VAASIQVVACASAGAVAARSTFTVPDFGVAFGEHLRLVGSSTALGDWQPNEGLALEWSEGNNWTASVELPAGAIEFKVVVIRGDGSADWESTENRGVDVPEGKGLVVTCHMGSGETHYHPAPESGDATEEPEGAVDMPLAVEDTPAVDTSGAAGASQTVDMPASAIDMTVDMADAGKLNPGFAAQASYDGAEGVQLQSSEVDSDATDGNRSVPDETPVEAVAAAEAHAEAQNTIPPLPPAATPAASKPQKAPEQAPQQSIAQQAESLAESLAEKLRSWLKRI